MVKHTFITLILKSKYVNTTTNFYLIFLCTTFRKLVTNVLANKLKPNVPFIIINSQSTFIKYQDISYNIALVQEICGELNVSIHVKAFCTKFYLRKAFDTINRNAIIFRMALLGFPNLFIDVIKAYILYIPFSIIYNGFIIGYF